MESTRRPGPIGHGRHDSRTEPEIAKMTTQTLVDIQTARRALSAEADALLALDGRLSDTVLAQAIEALVGCRGMVVTTGVGKAGIIARKISATLASTGTQSIFLHPVEALHGDLGRVRRDDVVMVLSHSGATEEIIRLLDHIKGRGVMVIALTGSGDSPLGRHADIVLDYGRFDEACPHNLAPTVSTTCMLAVGDALALAAMTTRKFTPEDFAAFHPAGSLGRRLIKVEEAMIALGDQRFKAVCDELTLGEALNQAREAPRRSGAMLLVDRAGRLSGILTDADLRRKLIAHGGTELWDRPVAQVMTRDPLRIRVGELASEALAIMNSRRIDELPVVDEDDRPIGLIDVQDLLGIRTVTDA